MPEITIRYEEISPSKGRYIAHVEGFEAEGEITFSRAGSTRIIVDHTGVPDVLGGKGVGKALAAHIVAEAREQGLTIVPLCPFVKAQAQKHPEWQDVVEL